MKDIFKKKLNVAEIGIAAGITGLIQLPIVYFAVRRAYKSGTKDGWDACNNLWDCRKKIEDVDERLAKITKEMNKRPD